MLHLSIFCRSSLFFIVFLVLATQPAAAQLRYGFKTGLNFANIDGPSETDDAGKTLENWDNLTGFHIGITLAYPITDHFGVRGEFMYAKRGAKYTFDGQTYRNFTVNNNLVTSTGTGRYLYTINNSYLDLPLTGYARWGDFEFVGGAYAGLLIQSVGQGSHTYSGITAAPQSSPTGELKFNLDYNFRRDKPGQGEGAEEVIAKVNGANVELPKILGAYFDYPEDRGSLYQSLDYGLVGGLSYYLSRSLYFHARVQYGLADLTKNDADQSKARAGEGGAPVYRDDKDRTFAIQASVGFSF